MEHIQIRLLDLTRHLLEASHTRRLVLATNNPMALLDLLVHKDLLARQGRKVIKELLVRRDQSDYLEQQDHLVLRAQQAIKVLQALSVLRDLKVNLGHQAAKVPQGRMARLEPLVHLVGKGPKAHKDLQGQTVLKDFPVTMVPLALLDPMDIPDQKVIKATKVLKDPQANLVPMVPKVDQVLKVLQDHKDHKDRKDRKDHKDLRAT